MYFQVPFYCKIYFLIARRALENTSPCIFETYCTNKITYSQNIFGITILPLSFDPGEMNHLSLQLLLKHLHKIKKPQSIPSRSWAVISFVLSEAQPINVDAAVCSFQWRMELMRLVANQREVMTRLLELLYDFEHKAQYLLIRAPYTRIVVCGHISNITPMFLQSQICRYTPTVFFIAAIFVKYCYTTHSWLL